MTVPKTGVTHVEFGDLLFSTGSAVLAADARTQLELVRQSVNAEGYKGPICVVGLTDGVGSDESNLALSQSRAANVKAALLQLGLANQMFVRGVGEAYATDESANSSLRRVDVIFSSCEEAIDGSDQ